MDWATFWTATMLFAIPGLVLLAIMMKLYPYQPAPRPADEAAAVSR
jgi:hypothetical protein